MPQTTTVFLNCAPWDARKRNTDWRYIRFGIPRLAEADPRLRFVLQSSAWVTAAENLKTIRKAIGWRISLPLNTFDTVSGRLSRRDLARSHADVVLTQEFPTNIGTTPFVWVNAVLDPAMQRSYGVTEQALKDEIDTKRPLFAKATRVQVYSRSEAVRLAAMFPESADRFTPVPFYLPHIQSCALADLERHRAATPVRILFVGNNARRKGLPELLTAYAALPDAVRSRTELIVISSFDRSPMTMPNLPGLTVLRGATSAQVMAEMRRAHIFVNVAHFESYGLVFLEAMSQGVACMGPAWEVQRELFDNGNAGVNLPADAVAIRLALERLIEDEAHRYALAVAGWNRFQKYYAPAVVAPQYRAMFEAAAQSPR